MIVIRIAVHVVFCLRYWGFYELLVVVEIAANERKLVFDVILKGKLFSLQGFFLSKNYTTENFRTRY